MKLFNYYDGGIKQLSQQHFRENFFFDRSAVTHDTYFGRRNSVPGRKRVERHSTSITNALTDDSATDLGLMSLLLKDVVGKQIIGGALIHTSRSFTLATEFNDEKICEKSHKICDFSFSTRWEAIKRTSSTDLSASSSL